MTVAIERVASPASVGTYAALLRDQTTTLAPSLLTETRRDVLQLPGMYSWWADDAGSRDLSAGVGLVVSSGLIYAGQTGATKWPGGTRSSSTLWLRLAKKHLGTRRRSSTLRRALFSILQNLDPGSELSEVELTCWMHEHLRVVVAPYANRDSLMDLEKRVLLQIDPPLNIEGMPTSDIRTRLTELRKMYR